MATSILAFYVFLMHVPNFVALIECMTKPPMDMEEEPTDEETGTLLHTLCRNEGHFGAKRITAQMQHKNNFPRTWDSTTPQLPIIAGQGLFFDPNT